MHLVLGFKSRNDDDDDGVTRGISDTCTYAIVYCFAGVVFKNIHGYVYYRLIYVKYNYCIIPNSRNVDDNAIRSNLY